jgi:small-conductance mechanosensitive channel
MQQERGTHVHISFSAKDWIFVIFLFCGALVFSNVIHFVIFRLLKRNQQVQTNQQEGHRRFSEIQRLMTAPARAVFVTISLQIGLHFVPDIPDNWRTQGEQFLGILLVLSLAWLAIAGVYLFESITLRRFDLSAADNLRARRVHTQMNFVRRILIGAVVVLSAGGLLWSMHDPTLWKWGTGLLASAGLASLLLAAAAKSTVSNLLAGLQIAFSEPIRIDDVVVIEGSWGRIEEITSTYVQVKVWDETRLIVPLSYFIENPFQNWTRRRADILGTAFLYVDYTVPVEPLRQELARIAHESKLWDGRVCGLQVTNLSEPTMELRCLVSSSNSSESFDLRCRVREKMIEFLRREYPTALPTMRFEMREQGREKPEQQIEIVDGLHR